MEETTWADALADWLLQAYTTGVPGAALDRAALHTFDAIACAAGAASAPPVGAVMRATRSPSGGPATLLFQGGTASVEQAVLVNGTSVRYLDFNDSFIGRGPGGHPSDNIPVALAFAEANGASGDATLRAITLGYELHWRVRTVLLKPSSAPWDGVSGSGVVAAAMGGLLAGLSRDELASAISIAGTWGYALGEVRRGHISMLKASANALVAHGGALAVALAREGMTGPPAVFEGQRGLLRTLGLEPNDDMLAALVAPPDWRILRATIKAFPAIGTSQAPLSATRVVASRLADAGVDVARDVAAIRVLLPDSDTTRDHLSMDERRHPRSRESADHSLPFLVACVLLDGALLADHFDQERWTDPQVAALMERVQLVPDESVNEHAVDCHPAIVEVELRDGSSERVEALTPHGSPDNPYAPADVARKLREIQVVGLSDDEVDAIAEACAGLGDAPDLRALMDAAG